MVLPNVLIQNDTEAPVWMPCWLLNPDSCPNADADTAVFLPWRGAKYVG